MKYILRVNFSETFYFDIKIENKEARDKFFENFFDYKIQKINNAAINTNNVLCIEKIDK